MITMHSAVFSVLNGYYLNPSLSIAYHATAVNEANAHEFNTMGRTSTLTVDHLGRWVRISDNSYSDTKIACRVFESRIMEAPLHREIRPIKVVSLGANLRFNR
jgi:hypothetical protein